MTLRMVDSITPGDIPVNDPATGRPWDYVLGYMDGAFGPNGTPPSAWTPSAWARFPNSVHVRCAISSATLDADVLDRETGDATAAQAVAWVQAKRARGDREPTVYVGLAEWGALQQAFTSAGVSHPHYGVAAYPGSGAVQETLNGITSVFHQYADPTYGPGGVGSGGHYDLSVVAPGWLTSTPLATPEGDDDMGDLKPMLTSGGWLVWCTKDSIEDTQQKPAGGTTWQGLPLGILTPAREQLLRQLQAAREAALLNPAPPATVTIDTANMTLDFPKDWTITQTDATTTTVKAD